MTLSPRLTRAALAFLLFGTAAALLPAQNNAALAGNGCFTGPAGGTGQFAIAPLSSDIRDNYLVTTTPTSFKFYYKASSASAYAGLSAGTSTTFFVNSGQVVINSVTYLAGSHPVSPSTNSSFTVAQVVTGRNFSNQPTSGAAGDVTFTTTYPGIKNTNHEDTYTAVVTVSATAFTS